MPPTEGPMGPASSQHPSHTQAPTRGLMGTICGNVDAREKHSCQGRAGLASTTCLCVAGAHCPPPRLQTVTARHGPSFLIRVAQAEPAGTTWPHAHSRQEGCLCPARLDQPSWTLRLTPRWTAAERLRGFHLCQAHASLVPLCASSTPHHQVKQSRGSKAVGLGAAAAAQAPGWRESGPKSSRTGNRGERG